LIASGIDPGEREIEQRERTFKAIAESYYARKGKEHRSRKWCEAALARAVYPTLGARPIESIARSDIVRLLDQIEDERGPFMANRILAIINPVFNWHATRSDTFRSPIVRGMQRIDERARSRVLSDEELRAIWRATEEYRHPFSAMLRFILLTATRRNEAGQIKRCEIIGTEWTIPAARYKTGINHVIPLSSMAQEVLAQMEGNFPGPLMADAFIFTTNGKQAIGGLTRHKQIVDKASGVVGWTIHDLRRTARSLMSRAGVGSDIAERCLGHVIGGVRGIYDRHEYLEEKRRAFEALAAQIERIINPPADNVVPLHG
jgi:integrase